MKNEGAMKYGDILMLWGMIFTMMGLLSVIQMGIMDGLPSFILTGSIFIVTGVILFILIILIEKKQLKIASID